MPKPNMYQSLHTTLIGPQGQPFEIQIRTLDMHRTAEYGIAAHWKYKEGVDEKGASANAEEEKLTWLRQVLEWQRDLSDNKEFLSLLKNDFDLFSDSVYAFTPTGDVKTLPTGSNTIDFAYSIHSAVGNKMVGARVNGKLVPIDYVIQNGDRIEIMTSQNSKGPSRDWLSIVKSTQAKNKINQWFKTVLREDNISRGKDQIYSYCKQKNITLNDLTKPEFINVILKKYGFKDWDNLMAAVGHGGLKESQIVNRLYEEYRKKNKLDITDQNVLEGIPENKGYKLTSQKSKSGIVVKGIHDLAVRFSKCCSPVPGDEIIGFVTRGRGVSIHRTDCINIINIPEEDRVRLIDSEWNVEDGKQTGVYPAEIKIYANNRTGVLVDISKVLTENKIDVLSMNVRTSKQGTASISIGFEINGVDQLNEIISKIRNVESVLDIERTAG
jgi:GTP pyrophosphokinase